MAAVGIFTLSEEKNDKKKTLANMLRHGSPQLPQVKEVMPCVKPGWG